MYQINSCTRKCRRTILEGSVELDGVWQFREVGLLAGDVADIAGDRMCSKSCLRG